uniref:hypothetical protein n=1 Tax=Mesomycoplasma ovipneumoniae TaxID=29562 RepID=UPI0030807DBE
MNFCLKTGKLGKKDEILPSRVSQFHKVILKKYPVLGTFLSFLVKVGYNFISDLLRYQSKN